MVIKKFLVSSAVVISFLGYSAYQKLHPPVRPMLLTVKSPLISITPSLTPTSTPTPTLTPTPTPAPPPHVISELQIAYPTPTQVPTETPIPSAGPTAPPPTPTPTNIPTPIPSGAYKDGTYSGDVTDAFYGYMQVQVVVSGGKISDIQFLQYPNDRQTSIEINSQALPILRSETIEAQNAQIDIVSGATDSSFAYIQSLKSALTKAKT